MTKYIPRNTIFQETLYRVLVSFFHYFPPKILAFLQGSCKDIKTCIVRWDTLMNVKTKTMLSITRFHQVPESSIFSTSLILIATVET